MLLTEIETHGRAVSFSYIGSLTEDQRLETASQIALRNSYKEVKEISIHVILEKGCGHSSRHLHRRSLLVKRNLS